MNITIVTVSTGPPKQPYYTYSQFFASCRKFGYEPVTLRGRYEGLGSKPKFLKHAIESGHIATEHMIFSDCFDVVMQDDPAPTIEKMMADYPDPKPRMIWGAEKSCFPDANLAGQHPPSVTAYRYLNSGVGFGETKAFHEMLVNMKADEIPPDSIQGGKHICPNDQDYVMRELLFGPVLMALDTHCQLVQNLCSVGPDELDFSDKLIRNKETGSTPVFFHLNGPAKTAGLREPLLAHLGL